MLHRIPLLELISLFKCNIRSLDCVSFLLRIPWNCSLILHNQQSKCNQIRYQIMNESMLIILHFFVVVVAGHVQVLVLPDQRLSARPQKRMESHMQECLWLWQQQRGRGKRKALKCTGYDIHERKKESKKAKGLVRNNIFVLCLSAQLYSTTRYSKSSFFYCQIPKS